MKTIFSAVAVAVLALAANKARADDNLFHSKVQANSTAIYYVSFTGGEKVFAILDSCGSGVLELDVYDLNGNLVGHDDTRGNNSSAQVIWSPPCTGIYAIAVTNPNSEAELFGVATN